MLIPEENVKDLAEIPDNIKNRLDIHPVKWIDQVLELALERMPEPLPQKTEAPVALAAQWMPDATCGCREALIAKHCSRTPIAARDRSSNGDTIDVPAHSPCVRARFA